MGDTPILMTVKEFSARCGIGLEATRRMTREDGFPSIKLGSKIMIHAEAAEKWLAEYAKKYIVD